MRRAFALGCAVAALAAGCTLPGPVATGRLDRPAVEEPVQSDARRKAKVHVELGMAYFQADRYGVALDEAKTAIAYDPTYSPVYLLMGLVHMYLEEPAIAEANFVQGLRIAPGEPELTNSYGWFLCATGREREGLQRLEQVARNPYYPTPTRAHANAGLCHLRLKDDSAAEEQFLRAVEADAGNLQALYHLAAITYRRGALPAAKRYLGALHQAGEPTAESLWLGIRLERRLGDRALESSYIQQLRRRYPGSPEYQALTQGQFQ